MGCLFILLALLSPRLLLAGLWFLTPYVQPNAFQGFLWPLLGLIFMPWMTLGLVWGYNTEFGLFQVVAIVVGALVDLGSFGGAERNRRSRDN